MGAVQAIGINTDTFNGEKKTYWIVRNSWTSSWGEQGYIYVEYGQNNLVSHRRLRLCNWPNLVMLFVFYVPAYIVQISFLFLFFFVLDYSNTVSSLLKCLVLFLCAFSRNKNRVAGKKKGVEKKKKKKKKKS